MSDTPTPEYFELGQFEIDTRTVRLLDEQYCRQNFLVLLGRASSKPGAKLHLGVLDPARCAQHVQHVSQRLNIDVEAVQLNAYEITKAIDIGFAVVRAKSRSDLKLRLRPTQKVTFDPESSADMIITEMLSQAITQGASDVHIEVYEDDVDVRYRIDGVLHQQTTPLAYDKLPAVVSRLKILSDLDIAERRRAQEGRIYATFQTEHGQRSVDIRLSICPAAFGEDVVMRILDSNKPLIGLGQLGFFSDVLDDYTSLVNNPEGLILVTGPTGSGKTTTLYSSINNVRTDSKKIMTVEDPVETFLPKTNQKQVSVTMGFADYIRAFLRQDPDVIMVGEIRDHDTTEIALRAAQTGHLVLSTIHANDAVGVVGRMSMLGASGRVIADTLLGSLSQRLVRRICSHCKTEVEPDEFTKQVFERIGVEFPVYAGAGCSRCRHSGYVGRLGLFELFVNRPESADWIAAEEPVYRIGREHAPLG